MSSTPPPTSPGPGPDPASPATDLKIHRAVEQAVFMMWNNQYDEAEAQLVGKKDTNPRVSLEYANLFLVLGLMSASSEQRESLLDKFKVADGLATKNRYGQAMDLSDSSDEDAEAEFVESAEVDESELSEKDRKKLEKLRKDREKKQRAKEEKEFKKAQKQAKRSGEQVNNSWKTECDVIYADALLVRSLLQLQLNSYVKGGINLRKTWGCYYQLIKEVENDTAGNIPKEIAMNIKYGCGVFYTYLALVPSGLMKLLSAIGFISDQELGEQYLTEVLHSNTIRSPFAALVLLTYYLFLPTGLGNVEVKLAKAKAILDHVNVAFPNNSYFNGYANFYHRKRGETTEAVEAITKATNFAKTSRAVPLLLQYLLADTLYMDLQFAPALRAYKQVLDTLDTTGESFAYTGQVAISMAACFVMTGDDASAMQWIKRVPSMYNPKSKQDSNSPKFAQKVIAEPRLLPLIGVYVLYINRDLAHMKIPHIERLLAELERVAAGRDLTPHEVKGMYNLFVGVMHKGCDRKAQALTFWQQTLAVENKMASDSMVLPYIYYEMGEMEYRSGDLRKAKQLFERGMKVSKDGHETLANRYSIAMRQLTREMKEKGL